MDQTKHKSCLSLVEKFPYVVKLSRISHFPIKLVKKIRNVRPVICFKENLNIVLYFYDCEETLLHRLNFCSCLIGVSISVSFFENKRKSKHILKFGLENVCESSNADLMLLLVETIKPLQFLSESFLGSEWKDFFCYEIALAWWIQKTHTAVCIKCSDKKAFDFIKILKINLRF